MAVAPVTTFLVVQQKILESIDQEEYTDENVACCLCML